MKRALLTLIFLALAGCDNSASKLEDANTEPSDDKIDLENQRVELESQLERVHREAEETARLANEMAGVVSRLGYEDWQTVVPDLQPLSDQLQRSAITTSAKAKNY